MTATVTLSGEAHRIGLGLRPWRDHGSSDIPRFKSRGSSGWGRGGGSSGDVLRLRLAAAASTTRGPECQRNCTPPGPVRLRKQSTTRGSAASTRTRCRQERFWLLRRGPRRHPRGSFDSFTQLRPEMACSFRRSQFAPVMLILPTRLRKLVVWYRTLGARRLAPAHGCRSSDAWAEEYPITPPIHRGISRFVLLIFPPHQRNAALSLFSLLCTQSICLDFGEVRHLLEKIVTNAWMAICYGVEQMTLLPCGRLKSQILWYRTREN